MKKRLISLLLVFCMVLSFVPASAFAVADTGNTAVELANPFEDVKETDWFYTYVQYARMNGFFSGTSKTTFSPNGTMTRGMFVTVLGRMAGVDAEQYKGQSDFSDVAADAWYAPYVKWAAKYGVTAGTGAGTFSPDANINREQMALLFVNYFESFGVDYGAETNPGSVPADLDSISAWAKEAVLKLWKRGLLVGDGTNFNPKGNATRAEAATLATRMDEVVAIWYKEPGVPSDRVKIDPATGLPFGTKVEAEETEDPTQPIEPEEKDEPEQTEEETKLPVYKFFSVTYTDGVEDEEIFADQRYRKRKGALTPEFDGVPNRVGYTFNGWSPEVTEKVAGETVYTAQWTINQYTVSFENTGDSVIMPITQDYKTAITPPSDPAKTGYTFTGWDVAIPTTMPAENVTVTAQWQINQYTITFDTKGGSEIAPITQDYNTVVTAPADPTRTGYTFAGWDQAVPGTIPAGDVTITANWTPNTYTITFDTLGGTMDNGAAGSMEVTYDTAYQLPTTSKEGWSFEGWYLPDGTTQVSTGSVVKITESTTLTAKWEVGESYNITYDLDGGFLNEANPTSYNVVTPTFTLKNPTKEGYTFTGWSGTELTGENNMTVTIPVGETGVRSYTAHWSINQYTITFATGEGATPIAPITQNYNTAITAPADPTLRGYTFTGWDVAVPATMPAGDMILTAKWQINQYTITFANTGGSVINPITQDYGTTVVAPADPVRTGYTFTGWDKEIPSVITDENVTITATWRINRYTITFVTGEGATDIAPITQNYGTTLTAPATPYWKGYTFIGWDKKFPETMPAEDLTLTAQWIVTMYSVNFYDGERLIDTLTAKEDDPLGAVPSIEKSSKANAILLGYFLDPQFTQPFYAENPVTEDFNVYAQYEEMGAPETLNFTSYAQMDQDPDLSFEITGTGDPTQAVTLEVKDGSDPVELVFEKSTNGYVVKAKDGFNPGCSYQLHLADGWTFYGKPDTIRTASFSIFMEEVYNLQMNDSIVYIQDTGAMNYTIGGATYDVLEGDLITDAAGTFNYSGADVAEGDLICVYVGTHPEQRNRNGDGSDTLDPAVYVKVTDIDGTTITFAALSAEDQLELYNVPDNFPILVEALPTGDTGTVNISALDPDVYVMMMGEGYSLQNAKEAVEPGDFVSLYISSEEVKAESDIYFGQITKYDAETGEITFKKTTSKAIEDCMNLYSDIGLEGDDLLAEEDKKEIEQTVLAQVKSSGFAEDAAFLLADMVTSTDGFRSNEGIRNFLVKDASGTPLTDEQLELLGLGGNFELSDDIELTVELITKGSQLHFKGGTQLAIGVDAEFEVELVDGDTIAIQLSATFVQEISIDPKIKGKMVKKEVMGFIPVPIGVKVNATIDVKSFTAFSFDATIYTVAAEEEGAWSKFKNLAKSTAKDLGIKVPDKLAEGIKTVKDITDKIQELEDMAAKAKETGEQYLGYLNDAKALWDAIESGNGNAAATLSAAAETFGKTSITSDLLDLMNMTTETGLSTKYYDSLDALLDRYNEMLEQESDWVKLVQEEILRVEASFYGVCIGIKADFIIRADMSLAIGSNLEYQVGKRFEFWFKIGLFEPSAGSSTMDLIDEKFGFQFYIMGRLGLKAGIAASFYVGVGSGEVASVAITAELGPYIKIYGFFIYEYTRYRKANNDNWVSNERMGGAIFMELGLYFMLRFEAQALKLFEYTYDFVDEEIPLLTVGEERYRCKMDYTPAENEVVYVLDEDKDSATGITMPLSNYMFSVAFVDLVMGIRGLENPEMDDFVITLSNPNFSFDKETGIVSVKVPDGVGYMKCDLTITYRHAKQPFSFYDMTTTVPLAWTNMSEEELTEFYTATVRVGNDLDGYDTVWVKRLLKNEQYTLPTTEEIFKQMRWNDYKYELGTGYGDIQTENLTLVEDRLYDYNIQYKTYSVTVTGVQNADGTVEDRTYYAKYGEAFDFSELKKTGTVDYTNGVFTSYAGLTVEGDIDLTRTVNAKLADVLKQGVTVRANYLDCGVSATFQFVGLDTPDVVMKLRRGDTPSIAGITKMVTDAKLTLTDISPAVGVLTAPTLYYVACHRTTNKDATITFVENGGAEVEDIVLPWDSLIQLPIPVRAGYEFGGWYSDEELTTEFAETKLPKEGATLYAKWTANSYNVTFNINGGTEMTGESAIVVTYDQPYGTLPTAKRTNYGFAGWFTAAKGGTQVTEDTLCSIGEDHVLYAQWRTLKDIPSSVFSFTKKTYTYSKDTKQYATYLFVPQSGAAYQKGDFKIEYLCEGYSGYSDHALKAGTYTVRITRDADDYYNKFQKSYTGVLVINKASRSLSGISVSQGSTQHLTSVTLNRPSISDLDSNATITYEINGQSTSERASYSQARVFGLSYGSSYSSVWISVSGDRNYKDASTTVSGTYKTKTPSSTKWTASGNYDTSWYKSTSSTFTLSTPAALAGLAYLVNNGTNFSGKTVRLSRSLDMSEYTWVPIGTSSKSFAGTFDGWGETVSGLYFNSSSTANVGLFGYCTGTIKDLVVDDSYFYGKNNVGGIVGTLKGGKVLNSVNYATVKADQTSKDDNYRSCAAGIAGYAYSSARVLNCVNHGAIHSQGRLTGGIVGNAASGTVVANNANFGSVTASTRFGGVVGCSEGTSTEVYNNYNCGTVRPRDGGNEYIGAIVGRNYEDEGTVQYNYYLSGSAKGGDGKSRYIAGTESSSISDGGTSKNMRYYGSSFSSSESSMGSGAGSYSGMTLYNALDAWSWSNGSSYDVSGWNIDDGPNGYPLPSAIYRSDIR